MSGGRLGTLADGLWYLHRTPDLAAMRAARSPGELARLALVPAARNLGIAAGFLPADLRSEATAALLACRVLDAYEDLSDRPLAAGAVVAAVDYLNGDTETPPPPLQAIAVRDSEAVDLVLAERIRDVRELLSELSFEGRKRIGRMLADVGHVMALNLDCPLPRTAYGEGVLGRVMLYVCSLVAEDACAEADLSELAGCIGVTAQLANDLRGRRTGAVRRLRPRGTDPGGNATRAGPRAGRLRPAGPARPLHPQSRRPRRDGLHDHHDDRVFVRVCRGRLRLTGDGCGWPRQCWPPFHPVTGPGCWSGCGVPPTGRSTGCSMHRATHQRTLASRPGRARVPRSCLWVIRARCRPQWARLSSAPPLR